MIDRHITNSIYPQSERVNYANSNRMVTGNRMKKNTRGGRSIKQILQKLPWRQKQQTPLFSIISFISSPSPLGLWLLTIQSSICLINLSIKLDAWKAQKAGLHFMSVTYSQLHLPPVICYWSQSAGFMGITEQRWKVPGNLGSTPQSTRDPVGGHYVNTLRVDLGNRGTLRW